MYEHSKSKETSKNIYDRYYTKKQHGIKRMNSKKSTDTKNQMTSLPNTNIHTSLKSTTSFIPSSTNNLMTSNHNSRIIYRRIDSKNSIGVDDFGNELEKINIQYSIKNYGSLSNEEIENNEIILNMQNW